MLKKTKLRLGAVAAATVAALAFGTMPAMADPSGFKPLAGAGSDTTQDVVAGLASVIPAIGSYDATGGGNIQTKSGGNSFKRPNGSGDGVFALGQSAQGGLYNGVDITGQLDFARSSSGPSGTSGALTYIPFAVDAVTFAVNVGSSFPRDIPLGSSATDNPDSSGLVPFTLRNIYRGAVTSFVDGEGNDVPIRALLPQSGSGTRSFWLTQLGLSSSPQVGTDLNGTVQEHDGSMVTGPGDIVPFSVAQYIAQGNHAAGLPTTVVERRSLVELGNIGSTSPFKLTTAGSVSTLSLNTAFPVKRTVYNVVQTSRLGESAIANTFVGSGSAVCQNGALIQKYGFGTASNCGVTTITGSFRTGA